MPKSWTLAAIVAAVVVVSARPDNGEGDGAVTLAVVRGTPSAAAGGAHPGDGARGSVRPRLAMTGQQQTAVDPLDPFQ